MITWNVFERSLVEYRTFNSAKSVRYKDNFGFKVWVHIIVFLTGNRTLLVQAKIAQEIEDHFSHIYISVVHPPNS